MMLAGNDSDESGASRIEIASIACEPPLGSLTVVDGPLVLFKVVIDTSAIKGDIEVLLWHEAANGWTDLPLSPVRRFSPQHGA